MTEHPDYIDVALALPVRKSYTYRASENLRPFVSVGKRALVPFGGRRATGYILGPAEPADGLRIKQILDLLDDAPLFPASMVPFFRWIADYYLAPIGEVIQTALPAGLNVHETSLLEMTDAGNGVLERGEGAPLELEVLKQLKNAPRALKDLNKKNDGNIPRAMVHAMVRAGWVEEVRRLRGGGTRPRMERFVSASDPAPSREGLSAARGRVLDILESRGEISVKELKALASNGPRLIKPLEASGHVVIRLKQVYRDPFGEPITPDSPPKLTEEQDQVVSRVLPSLDNGFSTYLLAGVTGSGKTEVYLRLAAEAVEKGRRVVVLVPEIALISQMERRFRARFGERVAVLHSGLSTGERYDQWMRILRNEAAIVVGARSAIFAPFTGPLLIIVDEEHDASYKQENTPRYNARDLAVVRAKLDEGAALLGSATPSMESYYNMTTGKFQELRLTRRVERRPLPGITLVDLRETRDLRGPRRFFSPELLEAMGKALGREEQVLLFLNRRGFATFPVCAACGDSMRCPNCDITLTLHKGARAYRCHYCGYAAAYGSVCPTCGSPNIKLMGMGTEKVAEAVRAFYPEARIARMDRDTTTRKGSILKILKALKKRSLDVLVGTQMVAKGHDFPHITLVGVICADLSLSFPDFRASERTFQLLAQVAGRAGRGNRPGRVILQTYTPDHFSIRTAKNQDFHAFYGQEAAFREALNYPPYSRMIQLKISGKDKEKTARAAWTVGELCRMILEDNPVFSRAIEIMGPIESPLQKIAGRHRWQILLKGPRVGPLHRFVRQLLNKRPSVFNNRAVKVSVDVDPFYLL